MTFCRILIAIVFSCLSAWGLPLRETLVAQDAISFNRDIRPILAANCFFCHGPDENHRESDLRLDQRSEAVDYGAIVPGSSEESLLVERILSTDPDSVMPPPHSEKSLTQQQQQTMIRWVESGADYEQHWAFIPPQQHRPPSLSNLIRDRDDKKALATWPRNEIDRFTLPAMLKAGLTPNPEADRYTLVRRVYLDLIGLPPTIAEADAFVNSDDPKAYQRLVDQLLRSPRYGEHWARSWLDLARYADTNGYEKDRPRSIWPYRDWVIRALNEDMPYDQFSIEQLAGDMLDNPTPQQLIATGFHRNTMLNEEGGIDPLEYRYLSMVDRVATTGTVWMGLSTGCAQCHTHKYDPISHTDYYSLMALLNNADEPDFFVPESRSQQKQRREAEYDVLELESQLIDKFPTGDGAGEGSEAIRRSRHLENELEAWRNELRPKTSNWTVVTPASWKTNLPRLEVLDDGSIFSTGDVTKRDEYELTFEIDESQLPVNSIRLEALPDDRLPDRGPGRTYYEGRKGDFFVSEINLSFAGSNPDRPAQEIEIERASHCHQEEDKKWSSSYVSDGDGSTGWQPGPRKGQRLQLVVNLAEPIQEPGPLTMRLLFERHYVVSLGRFRVAFSNNPDAVAINLPDAIERSLQAPPNEWTLETRARVQRHFLLTTPLLAKAHKELDVARSRIPARDHSMILQERPADHPRPTYRHHRGEYLNPREAVTPGILSLFAETMPPEQRPTNRLELARWLVSESNPLAARVAVNRAWRAFFGDGLLRTSGDFGVQAPLPSHPELLDWLAVELMQKGWSMKQLHRLIVNSATYRQSSTIDATKQKIDPTNRWFARGSRFRLTGESFRDACLHSSGTLCEKMYGPGVKPPQPDSVTQLAYGNAKWTPSTGPDRRRRSIYTFIKRTAPFAAYTTFDGPTGEVCVARRSRSNTPLQALTVMNDEMFLEFARSLGTRVAQMSHLESDSQKLTIIFRSVLTRPPTDSEENTISEFYQRQRERLANGELKAGPVMGTDDATDEMAALTMVARVIMNLDEAVMRN